MSDAPELNPSDPLENLCAAAGDTVIGVVGAGASHVAVGTNITQNFYGGVRLPTPDDREVIAQQPSKPLHIGVPSSGRELVGRESLLDKIVERLTSGETLALYGREGVGKTALAIALANDPRILEHFSDGVLWGGLGPAPNVAEVLDQWGRALGIDVTQIVELADRAQAVKNSIGTRRFLLVIDDSWGLDEDTEKLLRFGAPNSVHLITTRVRRWARQFAGHKHTQEVRKLNSQAAHKLLRELAEDAWKSDAATMRELAAAVDYIPLALELMGNFLAQPDYTAFPELRQERLVQLADPQVRLQLAKERLGQKGGKLTLAEVIELSLNGLPDEAVRAFYTLGAFAPQPARFDKEAVIVVSGTSLQMLSLLIDRGLLEVDKEEWLSLHQTVAAVAKRKLGTEVTLRHGDHYLKFANEDREDYQRIEAVYSQIQQAWAALAEDDERIYALIDAIATYHVRRGLWRENEEWLNRGLSLARVKQDRHGEGVMLNNLGIVYRSQGRWAEAISCYEQDLAICRALGDRQGEGVTLGNLGIVYRSQGRWAEAIAQYEASLAICRALGDRQGEGVTLNNLGYVYYLLGRWVEAVEQTEASLAICRELGERHGEGVALNNLGELYQEQGLWDEANIHYKLSLEIFRTLRDQHAEGQVLENVGELYQSQGDEAKAQAYFIEALTKLHPDSPEYRDLRQHLGLDNAEQDTAS